MATAKKSSLLQRCILHPLVGYLLVAVTAAVGVILFTSYQANQQWLQTARVAAKTASAGLSNALNAGDEQQIPAILNGIAQNIPGSRISLLTQDGAILATYPQAVAVNDPGFDLLPGHAVLHEVITLLTDDGTQLQVAIAQEPFWKHARDSVPALLIILSMTIALGVLHYLQQQAALNWPVTVLLRLIRSGDTAQGPTNSARRNVSMAVALDEVASYISKLTSAIQTQRQNLTQLETELTTHQRDLSKLVAERTAALVDLNKRFVQQQFDAKTSALEARCAHWDADKANQDKTRFLAAASHDLRQPLHAMSLFVEALKPELTTTRAVLIHTDLQRSLVSMKELFNALLDISKLEAGVMQPKTEDFAIQRLLDQLEVVFRQQAIARNLDLRLVASKYRVHTDPHLLQQVLVNLVANAIKHTTKGYVFVGCRIAKNLVRLLVWDSGPGIPAHQQQAIFEEFVQLNNPERDRSKGLGLGLSIVKRTCQLLGHEIRFSSVPGLGTRFEIIVPLAVELVAAPLTESGAIQPGAIQRIQPGAIQPIVTEPEAAVPDSAAAGQTRKAPLSSGAEADVYRQSVLIIDDDPSVLRGMKVLLESWNLQPWLASSVDSALQICQQTNQVPDLIISDLRLPDGCTGIAAIQRMQDFFKTSVPAILITGDTAPERLQLANQAPWPLLHKPIKPAQLRSVCASYL